MCSALVNNGPGPVAPSSLYMKLSQRKPQ